MMALATLPVACASEEPAPAPGPVGTHPLPSDDSIARFVVTVDPSSSEPLTIQPVGEAEATPHKPGMQRQTTGPLSPSDTVLLGTTPQVTVSGPGTYDKATHTMSAPVIVSHNDPSASDFDELQMVVTGITSKGNIQFVTNNNNNTGVGAVIALTDIQGASSKSTACGAGVKQKSAFHSLRIVDPTDVAFSFTIDVRANPAVGTISPDCDGDGYNAEVGEDAGNDCNNLDAGVSPITVATCACTAAACPTSGASCGMTPQNNGTFLCSSTTNPSGCVCDVNATAPQHDVIASCTQKCTFECNGVVDTTADTDSNACTGTCNTSTCQFGCSNLAGADCSYTCTRSTCGLTCNNANAATDCQYSSCSNGSVCTSACPGGAGACGASQCNGSTCKIDCGTAATSTFGGFCGVSNQCISGATCDVDCSGTGTGRCGVATCHGSSCNVTCGSAKEGAATFGDYCGIGECRNGATCNVTCKDSPHCYMLCRGGTTGNAAASCIMDCSALSAADQLTDKCNLDCRNSTKTAIGGGLYQCK